MNFIKNFNNAINNLRFYNSKNKWHNMYIKDGLTIGQIAIRTGLEDRNVRNILRGVGIRI